MRKFISVGQIINTHGIKGELKVYPLSDDIKRFRNLSKVYIDGEEKKVVWCKMQADKVILKLSDIETMEDAVKLKDKYIDVLREDAVTLKEGRYYIADIIGCSVVDTDGTNYGKISEVLQTGSNDVYWIKGENEILIPALKDIVLKIDIENEKITIKPVKTWL